MKNRKHVLAVIAVVAAIGLVTSLSANLLHNRQLSADVIGSTNCGGFPDIGPGTPACDVAQRMKDGGIFGGDITGNFRPNDAISRAEAVKVLVAAFYLEDLNVNAHYTSANFPFSDLPEGTSWYLPYLKVAMEKGVINGNSDGTFRPGDFLNRAEFAKILYSRMGNFQSEIQKAREWFEQNVGTGYLSTLGISSTDWYVSYMTYLMYVNKTGEVRGFLNHCNGQACPGNNITRFEAAAAITNMLSENNTGLNADISYDNCSKLSELQDITATLQALNITTALFQQCANAYPDIWSEEGSAYITSDVSRQNCERIRALHDFTGTLSRLGIDRGVAAQCANTYPDIWQGQQPSNTPPITEYVSRQNCENIKNLDDFTGTLSRLGLDGSIPAQCARTYPEVWYDNYINGSITEENCRNMGRLQDITGTLAELGINWEIAKACATIYPQIWYY